MKDRAPLLFVLAAALLSGCVATTTDVDRLQDSLNQVQKGQADLITQMEQLDRTIQTLNEKLSSNDKKMTALSQKLDDTQMRLGGRMESISRLLSEATTQASVPVPGELYRAAYGDYVAGKLPLAIAGFRTFLQRYPDSDLADDAQLYLADSYLQKKEYRTALSELDKLLATSQEYRRQALLKRAYALSGLGNVKNERITLEAVIKEFPESSEADSAQEMLKRLSGPGPKKKPARKKISDE